MFSSRGLLESCHGLLEQYKKLGRFDFGEYSFVPLADELALEARNIEFMDDYKKIYDIIKKRFHCSGFISLLCADDKVFIEGVNFLAENIGLKAFETQPQNLLGSMHKLFKRAVASDAIKNRKNIFNALQDIFRACKTIKVNCDFYKMAAISLAQFMLTNPCFAASRSSQDASTPKTWMLLLMEARVFIASLSNAEDRGRVLGVFQQAIAAQENKFIEAVEQHPLVLKLESGERRLKKVARFKETLADCSELFNPDIVGECDGPVIETSRSSVVAADLRDSLVRGYSQVCFDLKKFGVAKKEFGELLKRVESGGESIDANFIIQLVRGYLEYSWLTQPQSMSNSMFSFAKMSSFFGQKLSLSHPSMVWVQLITYARLLAETNAGSADSVSCLRSLYHMIDEMAEHKGWGQVREHFFALGQDLNRKITFDVGCK